MRFFSVITQDTHIGERYTCCARTPCACVSVIKVPRKLAHSLASAIRALACSILIRDIVAQSVSVVGYQSSMSRPPAEQAPREPVTYSSGSVMSGESVRQHGLSVPITPDRDRGRKVRWHSACILAHTRAHTRTRICTLVACCS